jgi:hypothetical protein
MQLQNYRQGNKVMNFDQEDQQQHAESKGESTYILVITSNHISKGHLNDHNHHRSSVM